MKENRYSRIKVPQSLFLRKSVKLRKQKQLFVGVSQLNVTNSTRANTSATMLLIITTSNVFFLCRFSEESLKTIFKQP